MRLMEFVWVVPRSIIFDNEEVQGFLPLGEVEIENRFLAPSREHGFFMERRYAETHPEYKQPIPYVAVCRGEEVFCLTRLNTQGEKRLHGRRSIGVGGLINPCDQVGSDSNEDIFTAACRRELTEELVLPDGQLPLIPLGILNDDSTEVGSVHLGLVYRLDADDLSVAIRETEAMEGGFATLSSLQSLITTDQDPFESWSSLLIRSGALSAAVSTLS